MPRLLPLCALLLFAACAKHGDDVQIGDAARPIALRAWVRVDPASDFDAKIPVADFAKLRGKVVLIERWATWCGPCIGKIPALIDLQKAHPGEFAIVSLSDEKPGVIARFIEKTTLNKLEKGRPKTPLKEALNYSVASVDHDDPDFAAYFGKLRGVPSFYILGPDGTVANATVGSYETVLAETSRLLASRERGEGETARAKRLLEVERAFGAASKARSALMERSPVPREEAAQAVRREIDLLDEMTREKPSLKLENAWKRLDLLPELWKYSSETQRPAALRELREARAALYEVLKTTNSSTMTWANFAIHLTMSEHPELIDAKTALEAADRAKACAVLETAYPVQDMGFYVKGLALFAAGDFEGAAREEKEAVARAHRVRKGRFEATRALYEDLLKDPKTPLEPLLKRREAAGYQSAAPLRAALDARERYRAASK